MTSSRFYAPTLQWSVVAVVIALWALFTETGVVSENVLPKVGDTAVAAGRILTSQDGLHNLGISGLEVLGAFILSTPLAIVLGYLLSELEQRRRRAGAFVQMLLSAAIGTPKFVFMPILIVIVGVNYWQKIIYAPIEGLLVMIVATAAGTYAVEGRVKAMCKAVGMGRFRFLWRVYFPAMLPLLVEALRLNVILIISGVMLAELYISSAGIGFLIHNWSTVNDVPNVFAGIVIVATITIIINALLHRLEKRLSKWRIDA
ncbi:ABC transporter permease subunit [Dactylosporangium sp. NPDC051485]|uniref:ABC transporter permease n=1 Tax=Dactylosporangium sp. NPDC051485 TaxID=3154846 RepID=UPI003424CAAC